MLQEPGTGTDALYGKKIKKMYCHKQVFLFFIKIYTFSLLD